MDNNISLFQLIILLILLILIIIFVYYITSYSWKVQDDVSEEENKEKTYYTIRGKMDGFGAQYQAIMSGIAYCKYANYSYIHSPIIYLEHLENDDKTLSDMNQFIGIPMSDSHPPSTTTTKIVEESYSELVHFSDHPDQFYTTDVRNQLKKYYYSTWKPTIKINDIAIHIRRGDVGNTQNKDRYTDNIIYRQILKQLITQYPSYSITIHSQGDIHDFKDLINNDIPMQFHLNKDIKTTFHSLVTAKVLVMSKSSFSYAAALLNDGDIYYMPFWHKPLQHWNLLQIESFL